MSSKQHTPGPWKVDHDFVCCLPDGKDGDWLIIARMPALADMIDHRNDGLAWQSNAKLIASAPEMLEALLKIKKVISYLPSTEEGIEALDALRSILAKVESES